jgi:hypothetical protein
MDETMREIVKKIMEQMRQNKQEERGNTQHHTPAQPLRCLQYIYLSGAIFFE